MLTDPQVLTVNAVAKSMPRLNQDGIVNGAMYRYKVTLDEYTTTIKHTDGKITGGVFGESHTVRVAYKLAATATVPESVAYATLKIENGDGMDLTQARYLTLALCAWATSATIDRLLIGES
jgi:hypothetical protein